MEWTAKIFDPANMRAAWEEVAKNKGAPGVDAVSIRRWARNWEERLVELTRAARTNTYRARKPRRFTIPKKDGTRRTLSILTVTDRVLQRAVLRAVDDTFDRAFLDCSFGYRPGRGVRDAVPVMLTHRDAGFQWVVDADIDNCFESLDHAIMLDLFQRTVEDAVVLRLLKQWLQVGAIAPGRGIPLGGVISPLLCNIVLHELDEALVNSGLAHVRYADDFCEFCNTREKAEFALQRTGQILTKLKLSFEPSKTRIAHFDEGFDFLGIHFYRDTYSFNAAGKKVEVKGEFDPELFYDYVPEGYR
jgi:group II intron reverse transcriptase/maturase